MNDQPSVFGLSRRRLAKLSGAVGMGLLLAPFRDAFGSECSIAPRTPIEGPYFFGDPEEKTDTGKAVVIRGVVRDESTCLAIANATVVRWHANTSGVYEEFYRASMPVRSDGTYQMSTIAPGAYANLDPHVHWYVTAPGYQPVIAQIQWRRGTVISAESAFDFSLPRL